MLTKGTGGFRNEKSLFQTDNHSYLMYAHLMHRVFHRI